MQVIGSPESFGSSTFQTLLSALLYISSLTRLQPNLSKAARAQQGLGLGLSHSRIYFRHLDDTFQGHQSGRFLRKVF